VTTATTGTEPTTVCRVVTVPVARPVGMTWEQLDAAVAPAFRLATDLANWCVRRLFVLDDGASEKTPAAVTGWSPYEDALTCTRCGRPTTKPIKRKSGKPPAPRCECAGAPTTRYPAAAQWDGALTGLNLVARRVLRKYKQQRFDVRVRHKNDLLTYRFPQPYPVHNQMWEVTREGGGRPVVTLPLPGAGRVRLELLATGPYRRQLAQVAGFIDGSVKRGEAMVDRDHKGQLLVRLVGHFPVADRPKAATRACFLHTDPGALLVAELDGRGPVILNHDELGRWGAAHRTFLRRVAEDTKREVRLDRRARANLNAARETRCAKHDNRVTTALQQVVCQVARFWQRQGVGLVAYDDTHQTYLPSFRWFELKARLMSRAEELGIEWIDGERYMGAAVTEHRPTPPNESAGSRGVYLSFPEKERDAWLRQVKLSRATALAGARAVTHARRRGSHPAVSPKSPPTPSRPRRTSPASAKR